VVLINIMKIIVKILMLITFTFCFSCEEQGLSVKCSDCTGEEPLGTDLEVKLDIQHNGYQTIINVYEGNLEDSVIYSSFRASGTKTTVHVNLNKKYTVTTTYYIPDDYYTVIDSATPRVKYEKSQCDEPCYFVYDKVIDLRLKYTN
jgi:hypothetical protein